MGLPAASSRSWPAPAGEAPSAPWRTWPAKIRWWTSERPCALCPVMAAAAATAEAMVSNGSSGGNGIRNSKRSSQHPRYQLQGRPGAQALHGRAVQGALPRPRQRLRDRGSGFGRISLSLWRSDGA